MKIDEKTKKSYKEVYRILEHCSLEIKNKIHKKFINTIYENMSKDYEPIIDYSINVNNQNLMPETYTIMALIYRDFICDKEKQKLLYEKENQERKQIEQDKRKKYNPNMFI